MRALFILMLTVAPLAAQTATVEGKVTEMGNGRPVRKAQVILRGLTQTGDPPQGDNYAAETDANGHFLIEGILPGKYQAAPSHAGFLTRPPGKPMQVGTFAQLTLAAGSHTTVDLKLIGTGVISGRTINLNGEPVPGAYTEAMQYSYPSRDDSPNGAVMVGLPTDGRKQLETHGGANSNDRGEFRFFGLAPGQYYLRVQQVGGREAVIACMGGFIAFNGRFNEVGNEFSFVADSIIADVAGRMNAPMQCMAQEPIRGPRPPMAFGRTFYPSAQDFSRATPLDVTSGSELRNIDIRLHAESAYSIKLTKAAQAGSDAFALDIRRRGDPGQLDNSIAFNQDAIEIHDLLPGSYIVSATSATSQDQEHPGLPLYARLTVDVVDRDVDGVTLAFAPLKTIGGTVKAEGTLTVPFSGMNVQLDADNSDTPSFTVHVNDDGTFTAQVRPEPYTLTRPRIATAYMKSIKMGDRELPGAHIDFARLDGPLTILFGVDAGRVEGTALDAKGQPVMPAKITLIPVGANSTMPGRLKIVNADETGKFAFPVVAPGEYKLFAWLDAELSAPQDPEFRKPYESQGVSVKVEPSARSSVQLTVIVTGH